MATVIEQAPRFSREEASSLAREIFGVTASPSFLPSERDQNVLLDPGSGPEFVLKIANSSEDREVLAAQNQALDYLGRRDPSLGTPRILPTSKGEPIGATQGSDGALHLVRLLSYVPGHLLVDASPHTAEILHSLGAFFGRLDQALEGFSHPAFKRDLQWDLRQAGRVVAKNLEHVTDRGRRKLLGHFQQRFGELVEPVLPKLRTSVIHNDGNDYNVLVTGIHALGGEVTGVIDFGDMVETHTVFELAVCAAYAILGKSDPVAAAAQVVGGYHQASPLSVSELDLLYDLIAMRLCTSVAISASRKEFQPDNPYLTVSEGPAWAALECLAGLSPRLATYAFRDACGKAACPRSAAVVQWLESNAEAIGPVVDPGIYKGGHVVFDLGARSSDLTSVRDLGNPEFLSAALSARMREAGVRLGIGRYDEARVMYTDQQFRPAGREVEHWRTVHLGMDLYMEPSAPVFAPLDGTIHSFRNNDRAFDYGPTIIVRHQADGVGEFFTLYGHLSEESLKGLYEGMPVAKGARVGTIGDSSVNGHWPPHLHIQVVTDLLDHSGEFPGVCAPRDRSLWLSLCPNPSLILRLPDIRQADPGSSPEGIVQARQDRLGQTLRASYQKPLKIVQGSMQFLYDHLGREFLDALNNVSHVGHCHPAVVRAAHEQMSRLNTNTRYLHDNIVQYAERLRATLPAPLSVCFFVCSGSEANELALRLARTHTNAKDIVVVDGGYHGNTTTLVDLSSYKFDGPGGAGAPSWVHKVLMPDVYRGPYKDQREAGRLYARHVHDALEQVAREGRQVAAFICESMLSCAGQIIPPPGYLAEAFRTVRAAGGVCIADEVQVGFGRVGSHFWGFGTQSVVPDIVTLGKAIGNGHPLAAVVTTPEIAASFAKGMEYFNTYGGNPVSCAVGLAVLKVIEQEQLQRNALTVGTYLKERLSSLMPKYSLIGDVRGEGLFLGIELVRDRATLEPAAAEAAYVAERMKDLGVLMSVDGVFRNVLKIKPPMVFSERDADRLTDNLDRTLTDRRLYCRLS